MTKPRLLILSHVLPFPQSTGQSRRVKYTLEALRARFHLTFATCAPETRVSAVKQGLLNTCDEAIVWKASSDTSRMRKVGIRAASWAYALATGLKTSNYYIGKVDFAPSVLAAKCLNQKFDAVLLEYWHASESMRMFQERGIPCIVDLHNVLWQARAKEIGDWRVPQTLAGLLARRYKNREEKAWIRFDGVITINRAEHDYIRDVLPSSHLFYAPMGVPLEAWPYSWEPQSPPRLMYYGGLGSSHNRRDALRCLREVMPRVWRQMPQVEFWIVGSDAPPEFSNLQGDPRVKVTGFVSRPQEVLNKATCVLCPWSGTYGFRSRLIEVMALGVSVVASTDAAYGMDLQEGQGFFPCSTDDQMAQRALDLLENVELAQAQSRLARRQMEELYSFESSYGRLATELHKWLTERRPERDRHEARAIARVS